VLHDGLKDGGHGGQDLEALLVRLWFCFFADDAGIFANNAFSSYIHASKEDGKVISTRLTRIFEDFNKDPKDRGPPNNFLLSDMLERLRGVSVAWNACGTYLRLIPPWKCKTGGFPIGSIFFFVALHLPR
jgi:hypothetical protein